MTAKYLSQTEYARRRGVSCAYVTKLKTKGLLKGALVKRGKRTLIDPDKADALLEQNLDPVEKIETIQKADIDMDCTFAEARTLNERFKAALNKLSLEERSGRLMPVSDVEKAAFNSGRMIRDQVQAIPDRCAALVASETDQFICRQILQTEIDYILKGLADAIKVLR